MQPLFNFHGNAVWSVLTFLGSGLAGALGLAALAYLLWTRRFEWARRVVIVGCAGAAAYMTLLLSFSLASDELAVPVGGEKYFCEVDCHQAMSVVGVERAGKLGVAPAEVPARGEFYIVKLRVWLDPDTTSPPRPKEIPPQPNPKRAVIVDADGKIHPQAVEAQLAAAKTKGALPSLVQPIRPGDAYETELIFDLPVGVREPRLLITERDPVTHFLIGHENSFLHKKTVMRLPGPRGQTARSE